jgi:hypothetical protein
MKPWIREDTIAVYQRKKCERENKFLNKARYFSVT